MVEVIVNVKLLMFLLPSRLLIGLFLAGILEALARRSTYIYMYIFIVNPKSAPRARYVVLFTFLIVADLPER